MCRFRRGVLLGSDIVLLLSATFCALALRDNFEISVARLTAMAPYFLATAAAAAVVLPLLQIDRTIWRFSALPDYLRVIFAVLMTVALTVSLTFFLFRLDGVPRSLPILQGLIACALMIGARVAFRQWHSERSRRRRQMRPLASPLADREITVLVVGVSRLTETYLQSVEELAPHRVHVAGLLGTKDRHVGRLVTASPILGRPEDVARVMRDLEPHGTRIDRIVVACAPSALTHAAWQALTEASELRGVELQVLGEALELFPADRSDHARLDEAGWDDAADKLRFALPNAASQPPRRRRYWAVKRMLDIALAAVLLVLLAPLFVVTALFVGLTIGAPVTFWQQRPGLSGVPFRLYKFRTMRAAFDPDGRPRTDAERTSAIGALLRQTRLDELPQLFSILRGDMSFIGPRPLLPRDQADRDCARLTVRPGLTGWAQVVGGRTISADDKAALDVWYIENASLLLDLSIALRTLPIILFGERIDQRAITKAWQDLSRRGVLQNVGETAAPRAQLIRP